MITHYSIGPWRAEKSLTTEITIRSAEATVIAGVRCDHHFSELEAMANARLIAAAPELLEALKLCEDVIGMARLQGKLSDNSLSPVNDALIAARAVLDKIRP